METQTNSSNTIEAQVQTLEQSINCYTGNLEKAIEAGKQLLEGSDKSSVSEIFYNAAILIVEPVFADEQAHDDYCAFIDVDPDNWIGFIKNSLGEEWGEIARVVSEYGY